MLKMVREYHLLLILQIVDNINTCVKLLTDDPSSQATPDAVTFTYKDKDGNHLHTLHKRASFKSGTFGSSSDANAIY